MGNSWDFDAKPSPGLFPGLARSLVQMWQVLTPVFRKFKALATSQICVRGAQVSESKKAFVIIQRGG